MRSIGHRQDNGFTLIELLVVVAVIALLIGLLLPTLSRARNAAQRAGDLSNLRQIGMAANMYAQDFERFSLADVRSTGGLWWVRGHALGGMTSSDLVLTRDSTNFMLDYLTESERMLNQYLYDDLDPRGYSINPGNEIIRPDERTDREVFSSPADDGSGAYGALPRGRVEPGESFYDILGTSYGQNVFFMPREFFDLSTYLSFLQNYPGGVRGFAGDIARDIYVRADQPRFVIAGGWDFLLSLDSNPDDFTITPQRVDGVFGNVGRHNVVFADGSARSILVNDEELFGESINLGSRGLYEPIDLGSRHVPGGDSWVVQIDVFHVARRLLKK